jgi:uncharacterized membrane protein YciS (DUF1049 family)
MSKKLKLALLIFLLGFLGVLSILTLDIPLPAEAQQIVDETFTPWQFKLLSLINPTIMLLTAVAIGTLLYEKVNFKLPVLEYFIYKKNRPDYQTILKYGVLGGILSGILITLTVLAFYPYLPAEFIQLAEKFKPGLLGRFLYGGFTEEILLRFGFMTFVVWVLSKIFKNHSSIIYWIGIGIAAIVFGLGHFPIVFVLLGTPSTLLLTYILVGNALGGLVFGWLYWKKGLEAAIIGHIFAHVIMLLGEQLFQI